MISPKSHLRNIIYCEAPTPGTKRRLVGKEGGLLWVVSPKDGSKLAEYKEESFPVFDRMSAAPGGLYLPQIDGTVVKYERGW